MEEHSLSGFSKLDSYLFLSFSLMSPSERTGTFASFSFCPLFVLGQTDPNSCPEFSPNKMVLCVYHSPWWTITSPFVFTFNIWDNRVKSKWILESEESHFNLGTAT